MAPVAVFLLLAAAPPVRLVIPTFSTDEELAPARARAWVADLKSQLERRGLEITSDPERADGTLLGELSGPATARVIELKVLSPTSQPLASASMTTESDAEVPATLEVLARELVTQLRPKFEAGRIPPEQGWLKKTHALWPALTAGLLGSVGGLLVQSSLSAQANLRQNPGPGDLEAALAGPRRTEAVGWSLISIGAGFLVAAIVVLVLGDPP
ncbi:MAG: hypothetical protein IPJ65_12065 [Archangiaceae bacterium]|nr:hypothetical protein [Archangiaceae bacterium]